MKKILLCSILVFAMALMSACGSSNNETTAMETTMTPTTSAGPTTGVDGMESTGVIDGMADDVKHGVEDVLDMTETARESTETR